MTLETQSRQYTGIPNMPTDYWKYMSSIEPLLRMGTPQRPKTWIVGFNGPRGGGKSGSAAFTCASQNLLRGIPVFAIPETYYIEIPIKWNNKVYHFHSEPLDIELLIKFDPALRGCCVLADEANMQLADAHRAMANRNLAISDYAQQCRHHDVSMYYTVIMAGWIDPRLRQLTDVLIYCTDASNSQSGEEYGLEEGEWCNWTVTDNSGLLTGIPFDVEPCSYNWALRLKDFWPIYESKNITDSQKARRNIQYTGNKIEINIGQEQGIDNYTLLAEQVEDVVMTSANSITPNKEGLVLLAAKELWKPFNAENDHGLQSQIGVIMSQSLGIKRKPRGDGVFYDLTGLAKQ